MSLVVPIVTVVLSASTSDTALMREFWGLENLHRLKHPSRVELLRVLPHEYEDQLLGDANPERVGGFVVTARKGAVEPRRAGKLAGLLTSGDHGLRRLKKFCGFSPGVAVRFTDSRGATDVLLCFNCMDVAWVQSSTAGEKRWLNWYLGGTETRDAERGSPTTDEWLRLDHSTLDMSAAGQTILRAVLELFPDEKDLAQRLADPATATRWASSFLAPFPARARDLLRMAMGTRGDSSFQFDIARDDVPDLLSGDARTLFESMSPKEFLVAAFRVLAVSEERWSAKEGAEDLLMKAATGATASDFLAALDAVQSEPRALKGAARLYFDRFSARFPLSERPSMAARLCRAVLYELDPTDQWFVLTKLHNFDSPDVREVLKEAAERGALQPPSGAEREPSARVAALVELARLGDRRVLTATRTPSSVRGHLVAAEAVALARALVGDPSALRVSVLQSGSYLISTLALVAVQRCPTRRHLDLLIEAMRWSGWPTTYLDAAAIIAKDDATFPTEPTVESVRRWWSRRRASWPEKALH